MDLPSILSGPVRVARGLYMLRVIQSFAVLALLGVIGSTATLPQAAVAQISAEDSAGTYILGIDDRMSLNVYGEAGLTGEQQVGPDGSITVPLIGKVQAAGRTVDAVSGEVRERLSMGFLKNPSVSITIQTFRPFYILGEVNRPGEYPYRKGMSVSDAVATAQGFSYRARKKFVFVKRQGAPEELRLELRPDLLVQPGDTLRIGERYF
jgi:protein involved in polysaccharide export with SLBB domain